MSKRSFPWIHLLFMPIAVAVIISYAPRLHSSISQHGEAVESSSGWHWGYHGGSGHLATGMAAAYGLVVLGVAVCAAILATAENQQRRDRIIVLVGVPSLGCLLLVERWILDWGFWTAHAFPLVVAVVFGVSLIPWAVHTSRRREQRRKEEEPSAIARMQEQIRRGIRCPYCPNAGDQFRAIKGGINRPRLFFQCLKCGLTFEP